MKVTYTSKNGQIAFEFEAVDPKDLFLQRSIVEMHDEEHCGICKGTDIRCEVRKSGEYTFYEMRCQNRACGARLEFGQNKDMKNLFVKRSEHPDTHGWFIYQGSDRDHDDAQQPTAPTKQQPSRSASPPPQGKPLNSSASPTTPVPTKRAPEDPHVRTLAGLEVADTAENANAWLTWGSQKLRTAAQKVEQEKAHKTALERIARRSQA